MAEERNQVRTLADSPRTPDLHVATPLTVSERDDNDGATALASDDPQQIREQIDRTREDMSQTINELQDRLSPQHLAQQARDSVREATVGRVQQMVGATRDKAAHVARRAQDAAAPVVEQVRERPTPIALAGVGAGLGWWLIRRASSRQTRSRDDMYNWDNNETMGSGWQGDGGWMRVLRDNPLPASIAAASISYLLWSRRSAIMSDADVDVRKAYDNSYDDDLTGASATERVSDAARDMGRQARDKATELGSMASEKASELGHQLTDTVRSARARAGQMTHHTSTEFDHWMQDNPLAVGVAAIAAGAVMGLTLPMSRAENRAMGASRDALMERATESAQQLKEQVRDKVEEVAGDFTNTSSSTKASPSPAPAV